MAPNFLGLTTDSPNASADEFQSNRAKDGFPKITPNDHPSPDSDRTSLSPVAGAGSKGVSVPPAPSPNLEPQL